MKADIAEQWIAALESGDYIQGQDALETADGKFCCLGVLCAIAPEGTVTREVFDNMVVFDSVSGLLPTSVKQWAGLDSVNGRLDNVLEQDGGYTSLVYFNDHKNYNFTQIAQLIRENVDSL